MNARWHVRSALIGLLIGMLPIGAPAEPIGRNSLGDILLEEGVPLNNLADNLSVVGDAVQEVRKTGPGVIPSLIGVDDEFLTNGALLHSEVREQVLIPTRARAPNARGFDSGAPDLLMETIEGALRATREAFFDGNDTANFSLVGIDLYVSLRGDRREISVNGIELLGPHSQLNEWSASSAIVNPAPNINAGDPLILRQVSTNDGQMIIANFRRLVLNPTTIIAAVVLFGLWVAILVVDVSRSRRG